MKKISSTSGRILTAVSLLLFIILWAVWFFCFRYYHIWLEGYSLFTTLPDFMTIYGRIPHGFTGYIGAFLHQFYAMPFLGAVIQSALAVWPAVCTGLMLMRLFRDPSGMMWVSCLPVLLVVFRQFWDLLLVHTLNICLIFTALLIVVSLVTIVWKPEWKCPSFLSFRFMNLIMTSVVLAFSVFILVFMDPRNREHEELARLEYLGENRQWMEILQRVSVQDAAADAMKRHYALLALSETGNLKEYAFRYGLKGSDGFLFYENIDPMSLNYNALFYQCLDMHNAVIHQAYQLGVQSVPGIGAASLRRLADTYLELKDYELAKKYLEILSHTTCHRKWVKDRLPQLEAIRDAVPEYGVDEHKSVIADFAHTLSSMVDRHPDNPKYSDLLLCALLADEEGDKFKNIFRYIARWQYPDGRNIPRLYEEALVLIYSVDPSVLDGITISDDTWNDFADYMQMMNSGRGTQALRKYADTYWAYSYR